MDIQEELEIMERNLDDYASLSFEEKYLAYVSAYRVLKSIKDKLDSGYLFIKAEN